MRCHPDIIAVQVARGIFPTPAHSRQHLYSATGFVIVELMIVIAILAALFSIAVPSYVAYTERARAAACR